MHRPGVPQKIGAGRGMGRMFPGSDALLLGDIVRSEDIARQAEACDANGNPPNIGACSRKLDNFPTVGRHPTLT